MFNLHDQENEESKTVVKFVVFNKVSPEQTSVLNTSREILKSGAFKDFILFEKFTELNGMEPAKVLFDGECRAIQWKVIKRPFYKRWSSVVGWYDDGVIYTYSQRFYAMNHHERVGHFCHELMHHYGFSHSFEPSRERDLSLPYRVGEFCEGLSRVPKP